MKMQTIALFGMVATAIGGVAYVFIYPLLSGERKVEQRRANVARAEPAARATRTQQKSRREQVEETLKEIDVKAKKPKSLPLTMKIAQAGLSWSKNQFLMISAGLGLVGFLAVLVMAGSLLPALGVGFAAAFGVPRWLLSFLKKRREKKFLNHFPDGVDVIVRGIKSGLPLLDSLKIIALDAQEPIKSEFKAIVETQTIGMPIGEACAKLYERMPLPEANFFGIVIYDSAEGRRQPVRSAWQPVARAARSQEDEGQDPSHVDGSQGISFDHRRVADLRRNTGLAHQPGLHRAALDRRARPLHDDGMRRVDEHRRLRDEENDQLRLLSNIRCFGR